MNRPVDFKRFLYQQPTWGSNLLPLPFEPKDGQQGNSQIKDYRPEQATTTGQPGTSGNMGMGSDNASLQYAESLMGGGSSSLGTSGSMGMGSDAASLAFAESGGSAAGGSGGSAAGGAGMGAMGIAAIVAAAIAAQHAFSNNTKTTVDGVETDDAFSGHYGTEPWLAFAHDKMDIGPTAGEKFDAAVDNGDWGKAFRRSFEMSDYWMDPGSTWAESGATGLGLDENVSGWMFNPIGELFGMF